MRHTLNGINIAFDDTGSGTPLLWIHGFPLDRTMWRGQVAGITGVRHIVPDLRGFGESDTPDGEYTMDQFADDQAALLDHLKVDRAVIIGLSMGGYIALAFARRHAARMAGLALTHTRMTPDTPEAAAGRRAMADRVMTEGVKVLVDGMAPKLFSQATQKERPVLLEDLRKVMLAQRPLGVRGALLGLASRPDSKATLAAVTVPTLIIAGTEDVITPPAESQAMAAVAKHAELVIHKGVGHIGNMEQPAEFNAAVQAFVKKIK